MMKPPGIPITRDLVLVGGGHTHALVLRRWAMNPLPGVQVTLINPQAKAPYTGMLPGHIAGHYDRSALDIDLVKLARRAGARLIIGYASEIDTMAKTVCVSGRPKITYDTLSVDIGITTQLTTLTGAAEHAVSAKPLGTFADAWEAYILARHKDTRRPEIAVMGGGVAGVELALAMAHKLRIDGLRSAKLRLIEVNTDILRDTAPAARRKLINALRRYDVEVITGAPAQTITDSEIRFQGGGVAIPANFVVTATGARPHEWLRDTGLTLHEGYIEVSDTLRSINTPNVFAAGDCAHLSFAPRPKAGVFAVRQAPVLFHNLRADLSGGKLSRYRPQKSYLKLISTGHKSAIADKWTLAPKGQWVWQIKDYIDQAFMKQFREPPIAPAVDLPRDVALGVRDLVDAREPQCGGCGAKVGQVPLLSGLSGTAETALDDAAIVDRGYGTQILTTDHLRGFCLDAWQMGKTCAVHAMGDIWAMNGTADAVLAHITLPPLAPIKQAAMIKDIMDGARSVFDACDTKIVGGHTSSGAELSVGFSISGKVDGNPVILSGARPDDVIFLTKPIGTGVILAAEMRQMADGDDYQKAIISMNRRQNKTASLLGPVASAMTDVTGFGLAGHLMTILDASGVSADLNLEAIPLLPGAHTLSKRGIRSSLWPLNSQIRTRMSVSQSAKTDLLFDPQTCGGLLACVPANKAEGLQSKFRMAGKPIWKIGVITPQKTPGITVKVR